MLVSGWKEVSMVDVHGKTTFTLWLCGCNLRCPFCHNWRIAQGEGCFKLNREELIAEVDANSFLVDCFHITGGGPLIQWKELRNLLVDVRRYLPISLNSNLTLVKPLERVIEFLDHVATDLKVPPTELYGLPRESSIKLWKLFLDGLSIVSNYSIPLELRIPVSRGFKVEDIKPWIEEGIERINTDFYVVLNPLVGPPLTDPRDKEWCAEHCWPRNEVEKLKDLLKSLGIEKVIVKSYP